MDRLTNRIRCSLFGLPTALALLATAAVAQAEVPHVVRDSATPCLNVRAQPNTGATPFECIPPGTRVTVIESVPFWRKIRLADDREGWAAKKFLEPSPAPTPVPVPSPLPENAWLEVHFVDVGQGDAIWIHTHDDGIGGNGIFEGRNIIIDGGPDSADHRNALLAYLRERAHHGAIIHTLILTHPHIDHYAGAETVFRHFEVSHYYDPGFPQAGTAYPAFLNAVRQETVGGQPANIMIGRDSFQPFDWGSELSAEILYAYPGSPASLGSGGTLVNNASIVLRLQYGNHTFLFMGDAEGKDRNDPPDSARYVERILLDTVPLERLQATVLKVGHHGSETSSTLPFIRVANPQVAVVCSGRKSFQGIFLPDTSTLQRYCCFNENIRIYRTDQNDEAQGRTAATDADGDHIIVRTNGTRIEVQAFESGQPFQVNACLPACPNP